MIHQPTSRFLITRRANSRTTRVMTQGNLDEHKTQGTFVFREILSIACHIRHVILRHAQRRTLRVQISANRRPTLSGIPGGGPRSERKGKFERAARMISARMGFSGTHYFADAESGHDHYRNYGQTRARFDSAPGASDRFVRMSELVFPILSERARARAVSSGSSEQLKHDSVH